MITGKFSGALCSFLILNRFVRGLRLLSRESPLLILIVPETVNGLNGTGGTFAFGLEDFFPDALLLLFQVLGLLSFAVDAEDVDELCDDPKLLLGAESEPVDNAEDVEDKMHEADD